MWPLLFHIFQLQDFLDQLAGSKGPQQAHPPTSAQLPAPYATRPHSARPQPLEPVPAHGYFSARTPAAGKSPETLAAQQAQKLPARSVTTAQNSPVALSSTKLLINKAGPSAEQESSEA